MTTEALSEGQMLSRKIATIEGYITMLNDASTSISICIRVPDRSDTNYFPESDINMMRAAASNAIRPILQRMLVQARRDFEAL